MLVDPYDHPSYQEHVVKLLDKQQRDQARAVAAAEKAQKGEDDELLHPLMRTAWEVTTPLMVYAAGSNYLPMVHVADAAAYLVALASPPGAGAIGGLPDSQQYLLVTDSPGPGQLAGVTQAELAKLVSERLGDGRLSTSPRADYT
ncbi:adenylate kinase 7 [Haematococcus lacustris]|uniref:Adenylate kinase 7 n=1 Tax=Haematococcus lacustris TaxID=44745 RepID=A0A699YDX3_HAELA|nr:adenylate kinase 7 [Haematococcus lacustris]